MSKSCVFPECVNRIPDSVDDDVCCTDHDAGYTRNDNEENTVTVTNAGHNVEPRRIETIVAAAHQPGTSEPGSGHWQDPQYFPTAADPREAEWQAEEIAAEQAIERYLESRGEDAHLEEQYEGYYDPF